LDLTFLCSQVFDCDALEAPASLADAKPGTINAAATIKLSAFIRVAPLIVIFAFLPN
jgi:hypothetical protein